MCFQLLTPMSVPLTVRVPLGHNYNGRAFVGIIPLGVVQARRNDRFARVEIFVYSLETGVSSSVIVCG